MFKLDYKAQDSKNNAIYQESASYEYQYELIDELERLQNLFNEEEIKYLYISLYGGTNNEDNKK